MYCFNTIEERQKEEERLLSIVDNPKSTQEDAKKAKDKIYECSTQLKIKKEKVFNKKTKSNIYNSHDYWGVSNGDYSFYFGYEETKCPVESHKEDCEDDGCEKREWCFTADYKDKEIVRWRKSELGINKNGEEILLLGIARFISEYTLLT